MIDKSQDIILFFTPEARVVPHYVAQCVVARTMQERGYRVLMARCLGDFSRCPVMDMMAAPYDFGGPAKSNLCNECHQIANQILGYHGLPAVDLKGFITPEIWKRVAAVLSEAPSDLRRFEFDGIHFGKLLANDLVLATKCSNFENLEDRYRTAWARYIENALAVYLAVQVMAERLRIKRILYHNEYGLNLGARLAAQKLGIPAITVQHASHLNVDRRRYVMDSEILHRAYDRLLEGWESWRNLSLSAKQVREVSDDIIFRFGAQGSHVYSPSKTVKQNQLFDRLRLVPERKLLVAFTSSLDEYLARKMVFEGMKVQGLELGGPFEDQVDWLRRLTDFTAASSDFQLVVRVHPREGANKRERSLSQHLHRLKSEFDREILHCRFIWPEDQISSYDLVELADLVLASWTTVGLEAARLGVPVIKAFGIYSYPNDDFLVWAPTVDEYFKQVVRLCSADACEERLLRAFRCHYVLKLASSVDLGDVIPSFNFDSIAAFQSPSESATVEEVIISLRSPRDINQAKLVAAQSEQRSAEEKQELTRQLRRIIHFLHTGRDEEPATLLWHSSRLAEGGTSNPDEGRANRWIFCDGPKTQYWDGTAKYERCSPLAARLAKLCAVQPVERPDEAARPELSKSAVVVVTSPKPKIVFVNTYYPQFLESHYRRNPGLDSAPYSKQLDSLVSRCFGDSDFYSAPLRAAGWDASDLLANCAQVQQTWARENAFLGNGFEIALEQIRRLRPNVVYIQDLSLATSAVLSAIRPHTDLIVGQIACPLPSQTDLARLDIVFSSFPHFVERFRASGVTAYYIPLAFDPRVLSKLPQVERRFATTFVGGLSAAHSQGTQFLEQVTRAVPVDFWGYGAETLSANSPIRARHRGEVWGLDMFSLLRQSRITLNRHIDVAEKYANNMRLFEATGCGALLITDYKENLNDLFEIGKEVVAYRDADECAALIQYYLSHLDEANAIASAGQARTLAEHTCANRMARIADILERHLAYRREKNRYGPVDLTKVSYDHKTIDRSKVTDDLTSAWKSAQIPRKQRALVQDELASMYQGKPPVVFCVLAEALRPRVKNGSSVLEIGCSSGYYSEVLGYLLRARFGYTGIDYSEAMIALAKDYYPRTDFRVADGAHLPFKDQEFDFAISSCILLHVPNFQQHIAETVRVAKRYVVAHRTPVCRQRSTQYLTKFAYEVKTVELRYNERELISSFLEHGLTLIDALQYQSSPERDEFEVTYVFQRKENSGLRNSS